MRARLRNGALVTGYNRKGWGGRGIYIFRDELEAELAALGRFLKQGDVFVDIGANVGAFAMKAAKEVGELGTVIAVEPFIESAHQLTRNIALNGFGNCRVRNFGMGRETGQARLYLNSDQPNCYSLVPGGAAMSISVFCATLNDLCAWEGIERLDYLKIDAEGAEEMILEGGEAAIARFRPIIQVETSLNRPSLPAGYCRFSVGGLNQMFIPAEREDAIATAKARGWSETW